jgi:hypothetical protein
LPVPGDPVLLIPDTLLPLPAPLPFGLTTEAVLIRTTITPPNGLLPIEVLSQAQLDPVAPLILEQDTSINFFDPAPFFPNGLELAFRELSPAEIFFTPMPLWFDVGLVRTALALTWKKTSMVMVNEPSFNISLKSPPGSDIYARTLIVKDKDTGDIVKELPISWPRFGLWSDMFQMLSSLPSLCSRPVRIQRSTALVKDLIDINDLSFDNPDVFSLPFQDVDGLPEIGVDISIDGINSSAFVQYEVHRDNDPVPVLIFTNEYATQPTGTIPPPLPKPDPPMPPDGFLLY